jgi:replication-associated recombination protein RarA
MLPTEYKPKKLADFIGPARRCAELLDRAIALAKPTGAPIKFLINGKPGVGKSSLAEYFQQQLGVTKWSTRKLNGTEVKCEVVDEMSASMAYKDMFGGYRLIWIDEADKIPSLAQVRILSFLDDLPRYAAVVCTSNCKLSEFEPRFQTRFQPLEIEGPTGEELFEFLKQFLPDTHHATLKGIATFACGNVRAALLDCQNALLAA